MFEVMKRLLFAREIQLEKGYISLLGQRMVLAPASTFVYIQKIGQELKQEEFVNKLIYYGAKVAGYNGFTTKIIKKFEFSENKTIKWQTDIAELGGWGEFTHIDTSIEKKSSTIRFHNSPVAVLFGSSRSPVDHFIRGYTAAVAELVFKEPTETIETKCQAMGHKYCEMVTVPTRALDPADKMVNEQLDLNGKIKKIAEALYERK